MRRRPENCAKADPRGMTLIEVVILMALTSVLSGIIISGMAALFRFNHSTNSHFVGQTALQQMATTLRADIHASTRCQWNAGEETLRLELPESRVLEYQKMQSRWVRVATTGEAEPITTSFGLDDSFRCYCEAEQVSRGQPISFTLINKPLESLDENAQTERTLRCDIVAVVGRDFSSLRE